jgi:hypothetical protein
MDIFSDTTGEKYLYRYRGANHFTIDEILNHYLYMTDRSQLNDLNEFKWKLETGGEGNIFNASIAEKTSWIARGIKSYIPEHIDLGMDNFTKDCVESISKGPKLHKDFIDKKLFELVLDIYQGLKEYYNNDVFRIACFTKKPLNATMMGHYGGNEGVIVAYDVQEIRKHLGDFALIPVNYDDKPYSHPLSKLHDPNTSGFYQDIHVGMCATKFKDWAYEEEVRLVLRNGEKIQKETHQFVLLPSAVAGVCLAPKIKKQFSNVLIQSCSQRKIPVFNVIEKEETYDFEVLEMDVEKYSYF